MKNVTLFIILLIVVKGHSQEIDPFFNQADGFFNTYVKDGRVDYEGLHNDSSKLDAVMTLAKDISISKENAKAYQAFWINTYNIAVIKGLVDRFPIKSPLDDKGFFDKTKYQLGGKEITLNDIEHELLRAQFHDARFHFVLVCGAVGCPPLISNAYRPETLDEQLDAQTRAALNGNFVKVDRKKNRVQVSQIMEWYRDDFKKGKMDELDFINTYRAEKIEGSFKLSYFPYDWNINKQ